MIVYTSKWKMRDSCGSQGLGETPECVSTRRLISRPRKASIFHLRLSNAIPAYYGGMYLNRVALVLSAVVPPFIQRSRTNIRRFFLSIQQNDYFDFLLPSCYSFPKRRLIHERL